MTAAPSHATNSLTDRDTALDTVESFPVARETSLENLDKVLAAIRTEIYEQIIKALAEVGIEIQGDQHPYEVATAYLNHLYRVFGREAGLPSSGFEKTAPMFHEGWFSSTQLPPPNESLSHLREEECRIAVSDMIEGLKDQVMNPVEIRKKLDPLFAYLLSHRPQIALEAIGKLKKVNPTIYYILHMELSLHGEHTVKTIQRLLAEVDIKLEGGAVADVGSGPGSVVWRLKESGILPPGEVFLIDPDPEFLPYASRLLKSDEKHRFTALPHAADKMHDLEAIKNHREGEKGGLDTVFSSMALQWVKNPQAVVKAMFESLKPGGIAVIVGEDPVNATAPTFLSMPHGLDIGYSDGLLSYVDLCKLLSDVGFQPVTHKITMEPMKMPGRIDQSKKLSSDQLKSANLVRAYSDHTMLATAWRKP